MKKKVSVEIRRSYKHYIINVEAELKKLGMKITSSRRKIGSIFGLLDEDYFSKVEGWKEVMGVFEVEKLPGELPIPTTLADLNLTDLNLTDLNLSGKEPAETK
tara:strand:- start:514 stop:822 length:309 start_codon:yes stop_codon:yes gene_type:complete